MQVPEAQEATESSKLPRQSSGSPHSPWKLHKMETGIHFHSWSNGNIGRTAPSIWGEEERKFFHFQRTKFLSIHTSIASIWNNTKIKGLGVWEKKKHSIHAMPFSFIQHLGNTGKTLNISLIHIAITHSSPRFWMSEMEWKGSAHVWQRYCPEYLGFRRQWNTANHWPEFWS